MIVVIADSADAAMKIARFSNYGTGPQAYPTVECAREWATKHYPIPQLSQYRIWKVPVSHDGILLQPTSENIR